jgi:hypothetical protein
MVAEHLLVGKRLMALDRPGGSNSADPGSGLDQEGSAAARARALVVSGEPQIACVASPRTDRMQMREVPHRSAVDPEASILMTRFL